MSLLTLSALVLWMAVGSQAQVTMPAASASDVEKAERQRFEAMTRDDLAALGQLLHDDLTYVHSNARRETKAEFLEALKSGTLKYVSIEPVEINVRTYGPAFAVIVGHLRVTTMSQGKPNPFTLRYTDVWVHRDGRWQMAAWQSTRIP